MDSGDRNRLSDAELRQCSTGCFRTDSPVPTYSLRSHRTDGSNHRVLLFEVLDRVGTFERLHRQLTEMSEEDVQLARHTAAALERLDIDVSRPV